MEQNRIKDILRKIEAGEQAEPLMPKLEKRVVEVAPSARAKPVVYKTSKWRMLVLALITFAILCLAGYGILLVYRNYRGLTDENPTNVISEVGKLTKLPEDETPSVQTVTEIESIKSQPFFKDALVGDKVLVYDVSKKAYLYRPSTGKIINIAPLSQ